MNGSSFHPLRIIALTLVADILLAGNWGRGGAATTRPVSPLASNTFNYQRELFGTPPTLSLSLLSVDAGTGEVLLGGGDTAQPSLPFTFDWGDGIAVDGYFNQQHTYADATKNYVISVTAHYSESDSDTQQIGVWFVPPALQEQPFPTGLSVTVPNQTTPLTTTMPGYGIPSLSFFDDTFFSSAHRRSDLEYLLSQTATIEFDLVNRNVQQGNGAFQEVILRDPLGSNAGSLWYTAPVAVAAGNSYISGASVQYSSLFHEMGHNFTMNTPSSYRYGGKVDGNANAIYTETMAQIFQHTAAYELINNAQTYGLTPELVTDVSASARSSMRIVRASYDDYVSAGMPFASWNDPGTPQDETFGTFMTLAYTFFKHAENDGWGYRLPLQRMMRLLQTFNPDLEQQYDRNNDTAAADAFRATLMVAAMSYGFGTDLRAEFRDLNFPVDDTIYTTLTDSVPTLVLLTPARLNFGIQKVATSSGMQSVALTNLALTALTISSLSTAGGQGGDFGLLHDCPLAPSTLAAGATCTINVTFTPTAGGPSKSSFLVASDAADSPHRVLFTGTGSSLSPSPASVDFHDQQVGSMSQPSPVMLTDVGSTPLHIWTAAITGGESSDFSLVNSCPVPPATLDGGSSCTISVRFAPAVTGTRQASLMISHDGGGSPTAVTLTGNGIPPAQSRNRRAQGPPRRAARRHRF